MRGSWRRFDFWLLGATLLLVVFGIAMVYSATLNVPTYESYPLRQVIYAGIGLLLLLAVATFDYRLLTSLQWPIYGIILAVLLAVAVLGQVRGGTSGWFNAGLFFIQPAEISKVLFAIVFAQFLSKHHDDLRKPQWVLAAFALLAVPMALIYMQPDLGTAIVLLVIGGIMLFVADLPWLYIISAVLAGALAIPLLWANLHGYMRERILIFLNPASDPDASFNIAQALISIGNGGLLGKGFTHGSQSQLHFLRVRYADFIFSVIAEELGLIGAALTLLLLLFVVWRVLRIADQAPDQFGKLLATGVAALIFFQVLINVGFNLRLMPVTGLTLPFISAGGSSLVSMMFAIGLAESVAMRHRKIDFY